MIRFTAMDIVAIVAGGGLVYVGPVLLAVAVLLLAVPALRWRAGTRRTAYGLLGLLALMAVLASPIALSELMSYGRQRAYDARTRRLDAPATFGGITFPAGSTVHVSEDGTPEFGTLSEPTPVLGLSLVGDFVLDAGFGVDGGDQPLRVVSGTLAAPVEVQGIPCGPGPFVPKGETTRCTLARDWMFTGHLLAAGTALEVYRSPLDEPPMLRFGSLARAELLYDVRWPPGTVLGQVNRPPERMAHGDGPEALLVQFCLPSGAVADIPGVAVLHGFLGFSVQEGRRLVSRVCSAVPDDPVGDDGYAQVGPDRFTDGERADARSRWTWDAPVKPEE